MKKALFFTAFYISVFARANTEQMDSENFLLEHASPVLTSLSSEAITENSMCICHGGPGNYFYSCEPETKTCYGGPGYYPFPCKVCPQQF